MVVSAREAVPNPRLRQAREARNLTQDEVADGLIQLGAKGVTGNLVSKWERGICQPNRFHQRLSCRFFEARAEGLGFGGERRVVPAGEASSRGELVGTAASAAVAAGRKRIMADPQRLDELDQDVERFALECLGVPHAELFPQVWDDWLQIEQFLDGRQSLKGRSHLTLLGGQLTYFLSRLSFNMSDYSAARRHAALAWQYAEDIGQPVLCASVRTLQGTIAFFAGQYERSLDCLQAAEQYATPYSRARIAANTARACTALGNQAGARQALAAMEAQALDLPIQPGDSPYTTAAAMSAMASTLARLGEGERAEGYARQAVALYHLPARFFEDWGNAMLKLATSFAVRRQPEPEEAARLCLEVVGVPEEQRTKQDRTQVGGRGTWTAQHVALPACGQGVRRTTPGVPAPGGLISQPGGCSMYGVAARRWVRPRPWWCRGCPHSRGAPR